MNRASFGLIALSAVLGATVVVVAQADSSAERAVDAARARWQDSPHGPMLARILPPTFEPVELPERDTRGAILADSGTFAQRTPVSATQQNTLRIVPINVCVRSSPTR